MHLLGLEENPANIFRYFRCYLYAGFLVWMHNDRRIGVGYHEFLMALQASNDSIIGAGKLIFDVKLLVTRRARVSGAIINYPANVDTVICVNIPRPQHGFIRREALAVRTSNSHLGSPIVYLESGHPFSRRLQHNADMNSL